VYAAEYGIKHIFESNFGIAVNILCWKSHLLVLPRLTQFGIYCPSRGEATVMNQGAYSIAGINFHGEKEVEAPNYTVDSQVVNSILAGLQRLVRLERWPAYLPVVCTKVNRPATGDSFLRSVDVSVAEPRPGDICILPGKMTETPFVVDEVLRIVLSRLEDGNIAWRPCDLSHVLTTQGNSVQSPIVDKPISSLLPAEV